MFRLGHVTLNSGWNVLRRNILLSFNILSRTRSETMIGSSLNQTKRGPAGLALVGIFMNTRNMNLNSNSTFPSLIHYQGPRSPYPSSMAKQQKCIAAAKYV